MLNIVIPMAGRGSRFAKNGYIAPKPMIDIHGKHMIEVVINNLKPKCEHKFIFICQELHVAEYKLDEVFARNCDNFEIVQINEITDGAAATVLKARDLINNDDQLMIANSDQWIDFDVDQYLDEFESSMLHGVMLTMKADDPKWSYAKVDEEGLVSEVVEKVVISDEATVGVYNFYFGRDFIYLADKMIETGNKSNGEYYVAPVYTLMYDDGGDVGVYNVGSESDGMYGLGIPSDLEAFLNLEVSKTATNF